LNSWLDYITNYNANEINEQSGKLNDAANANYSFQKCVAQDRDYQHLIDVLVGIFMHMGGYFDHAINISGLFFDYLCAN
jgi:hypothetical protein